MVPNDKVNLNDSKEEEEEDNDDDISNQSSVYSEIYND